ncbi:ABC transporter permease [Cohnella herbarum]|uniref:ABC transporter permease n=1 Tax=Cohnella herbarum TaxID=2728023 RepID=A0A7Z2ZJM9_9BACL|nr:ABC transporter permease [Cohnella herbarum]QJD82103.1 ABC transporter permease [Cohnella herbarum]
MKSNQATAGEINKPKGFQLKSGVGLLILYIIIVVFFSLKSPYFLTVNNFLNIGLATSILGIIAVAMTFVIISGGIDLSIGSIVALTGVITAQVYESSGSLPLAIISGLCIGVVMGLLNGFLITYLKINPLITTLGTMSIGRGLAFVMSGGSTSSMADFKYLGRGYLLGIPFPLILMIIIFIIAYFVLKHTIFGRTVYAIGGNEVASRLAAIPVRRNQMLIYLICGLAAALGGLILTSQLGAGAPQAATGIEMSVIAAVILGGCSLAGGRGTIIGTLLGVIILGTVNNGLVLLNVSSYWQEVARGFVLLAAVAIDQVQKLRKK